MKIFLLGVLLSVLFVACGGSSPGASAPLPTYTPYPTADTQATEDALRVKIFAELTASAPTHAPTAPAIVPSASPASSNIIGRRFLQSGIALTVHEITASPTFSGEPPKKDNRYIGLELTLENEDAELFRFADVDFSLRDPEGFEYNTAPNAFGKASLIGGQLGRGEKLRGHIIFEVPQAKSNFTFYYEMPFELRDQPPIRVSLDDVLSEVKVEPVSTEPSTSKATPASDETVELGEWTWYPDGDYINVDGSVKNVSSKPITFVKVFFELRDDGGKLLANDSTYTDPFNIAPGASAAFKLFRARPPGLEKVGIVNITWSEQP